MEGNCYLEVDVNGEEVFLVDKSVISFYSGKMSKLLGKMRGATGNLKVIFHGFPGGAESFELIMRFCYNKGKADINAFNIFHLIAAADFMEMSKSVDGAENLCEQIERSLEESKYWRWSEVVMSLKQLQNQRVGGISLAVLDKLLSSLVGRIVPCSERSPSPSVSSSDSSCDTKSSESFKSTSVRAMWWFDDLVALDSRVIEMLVRLMVLRNFDSGLISRFLFHYQKQRSASASCDEKIRIVEFVVEMIGFLDVSCVSCKSLFELLRVAVKLRVSRRCRNKVEGAIGSLLDQATLDDLLIPSSPSRCYLYNVNLVLNFLKSFLGKGVGSVESSRMAYVAGLIDLYLGEIAPDPCLKPSKFLAVIRALPDSARDTFDRVYHAANLYLEVHQGLSEEERKRLCCSINYEKLSRAALSHLAENTLFPLEHFALALVSQRSKLKSLLRSATATHEEGGDEDCDQVVLYVRQQDALSEHEKVKPRLQGLQTRVLEVESVCMKLQPQNVKMRKSRMLRLVYGRSLPLLCS